MTAPTLKEFISELHVRNIARTASFNVNITLPPMFWDRSPIRVLSMWCHGATTPQYSFFTNDNFLDNGTRRKFIYDHDHMNLVLHFYIDQKYDTRGLFDNWKDIILSNKRNLQYPANYTSEKIQVQLLNQEDKITYEYEYTRCVPKTVSSGELNFSVGNQIATFSVEFTFEEVNFKKYNDGGTPQFESNHRLTATASEGERTQSQFQTAADVAHTTDYGTVDPFQSLLQAIEVDSYNQ